MSLEETVSLSWQEHKLVKEHILEKDSIFVSDSAQNTLHTG